jgi:hypothetical protein
MIKRLAPKKKNGSRGERRCRHLLKGANEGVGVDCKGSLIDEMLDILAS